MANDNDDLINKVIADWSANTVDLLKAAVQKAGLELTDDLLNSLKVEVIRAAADNLAKANFRFRMHGRYKDMKTVYKNFSSTWRQKQFAPITEIEDFIKKTGLAKFKYVPGYKAGSIPTESRAIRRLAWAISIGIAKRNVTKAKKWYAKTFYNQITPLMVMMGEAARERTAAAIKEGFTKDTN